ncbi:MAG: DUF1553 domain-containing protein [Planctomycetaceae bacterium]
MLRCAYEANSMSAGELEETCVLSGGDPFSKEAAVAPGVLTAISSVPCADSIRHRGTPFTLCKMGCQPGQSIDDSHNCESSLALALRQPIAGNPNNFGSTGKRPTHPELLDWLAAEFVSRGWSVKAMHRLLMNSEAYRRSSLHPEPSVLTAKDPERSSYAVFSLPAILRGKNFATCLSQRMG